MPRQFGAGGLTTILNQDTYKQIRFRPMAVNRLDVNVGERPIRGISMMRNTNMTPVDSNIRFTRDDSRFFGKPRSDTARLGQSISSLPDSRGVEQAGGANISPELQSQLDERKVQEQAALKGAVDAAGGVKQKKKKKFKNLGPLGKVIRVGEDAVDFAKKHRIVSTGADIISTGATLLGHPEIGATAKGVGAVAGQLGFGKGRVAMARQELKGVHGGPSGMDKQFFNPLSPHNHNRARINDL